MEVFLTEKTGKLGRESEERGGRGRKKGRKREGSGEENEETR